MSMKDDFEKSVEEIHRVIESGTTREHIELRDALLEEAETIIDTLLAKRQDYGTLNIKITGRYGLAVRMQDKVSRLLNLTKPGANRPAVAESIDDTYRDLAGYALIGLVPKGWDL